MADKALNSVATDTSFDYFLGVKGTEVKKMTKEQVATVVGELLPGILTSLFILRGSISSVDYDTTITTGMYYVEGINSNTTFNDWGGLFVLNVGSRITQVKIGYNTMSIIYRIGNNNSWSNWAKIATT